MFSVHPATPRDRLQAGFARGVRSLVSVSTAAIALILAQDSLAAPAHPMLRSYLQPDGNSVELRLRGDEWCNWYETVSGALVEQAADGYWRYVERTAAGLMAGERLAQLSPPDGKREMLRPDCVHAQPPAAPVLTTASTAITVPILFILASFTDREGHYSEAAFADFIKTGLKRYYADVSFDLAKLKPAKESFGTANNGVVGWVQLTYAHPNTGSNFSTANKLLTRDAIVAADPFVDYASFDRNADGFVDAQELAVVVIVAGYETSYGGTAFTPTVWGHRWALDSATRATVDGVIVADDHGASGGYAQFGEIHQSSSGDAHQATLGIMVHELGHLIFNLPDLYDTDGSSNGVGAWCVMSYGSWGRSDDDRWAGETPVMPSAWIRYRLGWLDAMSGTGTALLTAAAADEASPANTVWRANTASVSEYFLVENRMPKGYDRGLHGLIGAEFGGLAIWHIDESRTSNSNDGWRLVDLEEADHSSSAFAPGNLFYKGNAASSNKFNASSVPSSSSYEGTNTKISVIRISKPASTASAEISTRY